MFKSLIKGVVYASRNIRMVILMYVFNFLFTLPLLVLAYMTILATVKNRLMAQSMFADKLDVNWLTDLINNRFPEVPIESLGTSLSVIPILFIGYLMINAFFSGGILSLYNMEEKRAENGEVTARLSIINAYVANIEADLKTFWGGCWKYFGRFLRLLIITLIFYGAVILAGKLIYNQYQSYADKVDAFGDVAYLNWIMLALALLSYVIVNIIFDYAKIGIVIYATPSVIKETLRAIGFSLRRILGAFFIYSLISLIGLGLYIALVWLRSGIDQSSIKATLLALLIGQIAIFVSIWFRAVLLGAEFNYYRR